MRRGSALGLAAVAGLLAIVALVIAEGESGQATPALPLPAPFREVLAGTGIVEPLGGSIAIGTPVSGIVATVNVQPGDTVQAGALLFRLDDADLQSQRPGLVAALREAQARLAQANDLYRLVLNVADSRALSEEETVLRRTAANVAAAGLATSQARLTQLDADVARRSIRARASGSILQINIRPGESAQASPSRPLMLMAAGERLMLRVDIDEFEAGRLKPGAHGVASPRGRPTLQLPLTFVRIEPSIVAKTSLTGSNTERVDSRVLQVVYSFAPGERMALVGQQMDVHIDAASAEPSK